MGGAGGKLLGLLLCLQCLTELHGVFIRFTNVTCESKDLTMSIVEYCAVTTLSKNKNSISLRYAMLKPVFRNIEKEKYISIDGLTNTEVSAKIRGVPMPKGFYALFTKWSTENITRVLTNYYFEVISP
ncbi:GM20826 [Drosophila sechellia]|uniref:GM20826 n=1 Tax=Drosophila sechellia TaxID=7238 RepID=B4HQF9_DROSE|nr:GM20826 [Drosophila sechellia]